jgi:hypothetical protein
VAVDEIEDSDSVGDGFQADVWGMKLTYFITLDKSESPTALGISCLTPEQIDKVKRLGSQQSGEVKPVMIPLKDWPTVVKIVKDLRVKLGE